MKIVLIEERNGQPQPPERSYEQEAVKIGRDPAECHIVFNQSEWPMVSRRHAEFRFKNGRCLIVDTNSSFGTFLNGRRVMEPAEVGPGSRVQFGAGGPVMLVARIEQDAPPQPRPDLSELETRRDMDRDQPEEVTAPREAARIPIPGAPPQPPPPPQQQ
ncbi:MAG TPA: FHA domain-containing protein, partial [Pyrinomonadaceae bacterium]|nr:FHA domain-containing protein [Pyrinomonadaceae bacterium]